MPFNACIVALYSLVGLCIWWLIENAGSVWSWIYFKLQDGAMAFAEVVLLWLLIVVTIALFLRISRLAAVLLLPYLGWVAYASALTWSTWQRNPQLL